MSKETPRTHLRRRLHTPDRSLSSPGGEIKLENGHDQNDPLDKHLFTPDIPRTTVSIPLSPVDDEDASDSESSGDVDYDVPPAGDAAEDEDLPVHQGARVDSPEPIRRKSSMLARPGEPTQLASRSPSWYEFDLSVVVALISPIGNWLTGGGDHVKNLLLILFLIFYLHQIIELPWALYNQARPRRRMPRSAEQTQEDRNNKLALAQLRTFEMFFLACTVLSPLVGALLLRWASSIVTGRDVISWFSTGLFVLATGVRPWKHLIERLQQRTDDLHDAIHYPQSDNYIEEMRDQLEQMQERVDRLEEVLAHVQGKIVMAKEEMYECVDEAVDEVEKAMKKHEKKCDALYAAQELQLVNLSQSVEALKKGTDALIKSNGYFSSTPRKSHTVDWALSFFEGTLIRSNSLSSTSPVRPKSPSVSKHTRFPSSPRLETIPEDSDFRFQSPSRRSTMSASPIIKSAPILRIPGFGLVLRIGDLATLPLRAVIQYLLSRRVYSAQSP